MATNMDLADKIELDQVISFPTTKSTWNIIERLSPYPEPTAGNYMPVSDSFGHSYVFRVELGGSGEKIVSNVIPKFAIVKMKSSAAKASDAIEPGVLNEMRALEQLTLNRSVHTPTILDAKVELHLTSTRNFEPAEGTLDERKHYVTYILMTEVKGLCLKGNTFWSLTVEERRLVRMAFRTAITNISSCWITFPVSNPKHLIWNAQAATITFVNFERTLTFNNLGTMVDTEEHGISRTLPTRYQTWSNTWFADWGLSKDTINPFTTGTDGTVFEDDTWLQNYKAIVIQEPKMPGKNLQCVLVGAGGSKIGENAERKEYLIQLATFKRMTDSKCCVM